jgi:hypothetical protein
VGAQWERWQGTGEVVSSKGIVTGLGMPDWIEGTWIPIKKGSLSRDSQLSSHVCVRGDRGMRLDCTDCVMLNGNV